MWRSGKGEGGQLGAPTIGLGRSFSCFSGAAVGARTESSLKTMQNSLKLDPFKSRKSIDSKIMNPLWRNEHGNRGTVNLTVSN